MALHKCQVLSIILSCKANCVMLINCFMTSSTVSIFFQCKKDFPYVLTRILYIRTVP